MPPHHLCQPHSINHPLLTADPYTPVLLLPCAAGTGAVPLTPESGASSAAYGDGMPGSYGGDLYLDPESSVPLVDTLTTLESAPASAPAPATAPAVPTPPVRSAAGAARRGAAAALAGAAALLALLVL